MSIFNRRRAREPFETLAERHERALYLLCLRMMGNAQDAQDCVQEALLRAFRAYDGFRGDADGKTWLYRIAYNTCLDALRKRRQEVSLEALREQGFDPVDQRMPRPGEALERQELRRQIEAAMAQLPEDQRAVMILRDFQQMPYEEIAKVLRISEGTVKSRLNRAREKVKNCLLSMEQTGSPRVKGKEGRQK